MNVDGGRFLRVEENSPAYDDYVASSAAATPFHRRAWGEAVAAGCGQRAHHLVAFRGDRAVGALPLTAFRSRLFGSKLVSNGFAVEGGPLFDDEAALAALDAAAWDLACAAGIPVLEYRGPGRLHEDWAQKPHLYAGFRRPIEPDSDANLKAIPRKQRAEVRRSLTLGLDVRVGREESDLRDHYRVYAASVRNLGTPVFPRRLFREVLARFGTDADILTVFREGEPVASVLSLYDRGTVYPYWGGGTHAARGLRANEHMYWMLMEQARERGCTQFDFGRSKVGTGAYAYKKNWGFEPRPLTYEFRLRPGAAMPDLNPASPRYRALTRLWQRLPLWLANRAGPPIARKLG